MAVIDVFFQKMKNTSEVNWEAYSVDSTCFVNLPPSISNAIKDSRVIKFISLPVYKGPVYNSERTSQLLGTFATENPYVHFQLPEEIPISARDRFSNDLYVRIDDIQAALSDENVVKERFARLKGIFSNKR